MISNYIKFDIRRYTMSRTIVDINDKLLKKARKLTGLKKKVDLVNEGLNQLVKQKSIEEIKKYQGKINWEGNLEEMRRSRSDTCR